MSMRLELHLLLWSSAVATTSVAGMSLLTPRPLVPTTLLGPVPANDRFVVAEQQTLIPIHIDPSSAPIFLIAEPEADLPSRPVVTARESDDLLLRGVIAVGGKPKAVFAIGRSKPEYVTAGIGAYVGGYRVLTVTTDAATLVDEATQATHDLQLRGTGEVSR